MLDLIKVILNKEQLDSHLEEKKEREIEDVLRSLLNELSPREEELIRLMYGLADNHPRTSYELSIRFQVSEKVINDTIEEGIKKLQHPNRRKRLEDVVLVPYNYKVTINNPNGGEDTYFEGCVLYEEAYKNWQEIVDAQIKDRNENNVPFRSVHFYRDNKRLFSES